MPNQNSPMEKGDTVALQHAARQAGRRTEITAIIEGRDTFERQCTEVRTIVHDHHGSYVLETERRKGGQPRQATPTDLVILLTIQHKAGGPEYIGLPANFAFWNDDKDMYELERIVPLVAENAEMTAANLADILTDAYFCPSVDSPKDDPEQKELTEYRTAALAKAAELLGETA